MCIRDSNDTYNAANSNTVSPFANGVTLNFPSNGATLALPVTTSSVLTFVIGANTVVTSPTTVTAGALIEINDAALTALLIGGTLGDVITIDSLTIAL